MLIASDDGDPGPNRHGGTSALHLDVLAANNPQGDLRQFHAKHFPAAPLPEHYLHGVNEEVQEEYYDEDDDGLGYYDDGAKRTLTDEQIALFRHSEIQRILLERRRRQEAGEPIHGPPAPDLAMKDAHSPPADAMPVASPASDQSTPMSISSDDEDKSTPAAAPPQKWTTTSDKTRARNAKNRKKNRKNHRERKKAERKRMEQEERDARRRGQQGTAPEDDESDEWDPWHQANGPDAQKDDTVDLDY